jgi:ubiquinone/menaquinone biosynthesis C-methylase UbiE
MRMRFDKVIESTAPYQNKTVLDVGCGAGRYSIALALSGVKHVLGIDFARNMIEDAAQRARQLKVDHICRFQKADFMQMDVEGTFDHTFAMGVLDYIENPGAFVQKMVQVTSRTVMVSFPSSGGIVQWFRRHYFFKIKKCPVYFYSGEDVRRIAEQAGGQSFTIDKLAKDYFLTINIKKD